MVTKLSKERLFNVNYKKTEQAYLNDRIDKACVYAKIAKENAVSLKARIKVACMQIRCFIGAGMYFQAKAVINDILCMDEYNDQAVAYNCILEAQCFEPDALEQKEKEIEFWCKLTGNMRRDITPEAQLEYILARAVEANPKLTNSDYRMNANFSRGFTRFEKCRYEESNASFRLSEINDTKKNPRVPVWKNISQAACDFIAKDKSAAEQTYAELLSFAKQKEIMAIAILKCFKRAFKDSGVEIINIGLPKKYAIKRNSDTFLVTAYINDSKSDFALNFIRKIKSNKENHEFIPRLEFLKVYALYNTGDTEGAMRQLSSTNAIIGEYTYGIELYSLIKGYIQRGVEKLEDIDVFTGLPKLVLDEIDEFVSNIDKLSDIELVEAFNDNPLLRIFLRILLCTKYYEIYNYPKEYGKIVFDRFKTLSGDNYDIKIYLIDLLKISTSDVSWAYKYTLDTLVDMDIDGLTVVYSNYDRSIVNTVSCFKNFDNDIIKQIYMYALKLCMRCRSHSIAKLNKNFQELYSTMDTSKISENDINVHVFFLVYAATTGEDMKEIFDELLAK